MANNSRREDKYALLLAGIGIALLAVGIARYVRSHHFTPGQLWRPLVAIPGAIIVLLILDYTVHHARVASVIVLVMLAMLTWQSAAFCTGLGAGLLILIFAHGR